MLLLMSGCVPGFGIWSGLYPYLLPRTMTPRTQVRTENGVMETFKLEEVKRKHVAPPGYVRPESAFVAFCFACCVWRAAALNCPD